MHIYCRKQRKLVLYLPNLDENTCIVKMLLQDNPNMKLKGLH